MDASCPENLNDVAQAPARLPHYGGFVGFDGSFFGDGEWVEGVFYFSQDYIERKLLRPLEWHPDWEHKPSLLKWLKTIERKLLLRPLEWHPNLEHKASLLKWLKTRNHEDLTNEVRDRIKSFIIPKTREGLGFAYCKVCDKKYSAEELTFELPLHGHGLRAGKNFDKIYCPAEHCLFAEFVLHALKARSY